VLLDVDSWADAASAAQPGGGSPPQRSRPAVASGATDVDGCAALLRSAGWRVVVVRRGTATSTVWQLLLAGTPATRYTSVGADR